MKSAVRWSYGALKWFSSGAGEEGREGGGSDGGGGGCRGGEHGVLPQYPCPSPAAAAAAV